MDSVVNNANILELTNKSTRSTESIILLVVVIIIMIFVIYRFYGVFNISSALSASTTKKFRSHRIPYIPKNMQLKDKDNKISRHLKFRFIYTCSADVFNQIAKTSDQINNVRELFYFKKGDNLWVGFFVVETEDIDLPSDIAEQIVEYPYKLYDTYVMGETRIFNDIEDILINQGYDRDAYGENSISTTYLNEICSNKMEYIRYFLKHGLMMATWIKPYRKSGNNEYPNKYVKAPYSSRSACASLNKIDSELCYLTDGVIVQEENKMLSKYELKCYVIDGKITMNIVRLDGKNFNVCIPEDMEGISPEMRKMLKKYEHNVEELCLKTYYYTNALTAMRVAKLENDTREAEELIKDLKSTIDSDSRYTELSEHETLRIKYILTGLVNAVKLDLINTLNTTYNKSYDPGKFTRRVVDYPDPMDGVRDLVAYNYQSKKSKSNKLDLDKFTDIVSDLKIYDRFMRVDMALPDVEQSGVYDKLTVTEIEPLASGIYLYKTIGACMKDDDMNTFDNIVKYNLYSIISTIDDANSQKAKE